MTDVKQVTGPAGAPEPSRKQRDVDGEAFKKAMKRVREVDPEEQRKNAKSKQEAEEESKADQTAEGPAAPKKMPRTKPPQRIHLRLNWEERHLEEREVQWEPPLPEQPLEQRLQMKKKLPQPLLKPHPIIPKLPLTFQAGRKQSIPPKR